ncbi:MAG: helix-turn-helix domain-containing protein [Azospirillaceae bacterium]
MSEFGFDRIRDGLADALDFARGGRPEAFRVHIPDAIDVRAIRRTTGLSQEKFSALYGIPAATLREWEQGRRVPDGAARAYLMVIRTIPVEAANALRRAGLPAES